MFVYLMMLPDWLPGLYLKVVVVGSSWSVSGRPAGGRVGSCMLLGLPFTLRAGVLPPTDVCVKLKRVVLVFSLSSVLVVRLLGHVVVVGLDRARSGRRCRCVSVTPVWASSFLVSVGLALAVVARVVVVVLVAVDGAIAACVRRDTLCRGCCRLLEVRSLLGSCQLSLLPVSVGSGITGCSCLTLS